MDSARRSAQGVQTRPATMADLDAVLVVRVACERADRALGAATTRGELLAAWQARDTRLATDTWVVTAAEGRMVAWAEISPHPLGATQVLQVWVLPDHRGHGIEAALLRLAETRALAFGAESGSWPLTLFTQVLDANTALRHALSDAGYALTSSFQVMEIAMAEPPLPPPEMPAIEVRPFVVGRDEQAVYAADEEAFLDERGKTPRTFEQWSRRLNLNENFDPTLWLVAWDGDQVAGSALNEATNEAGRKVGRIHHLGVRRPWRRCGLGMALLRQTLGAFYRRGHSTVRLNVDAQSLTNAHRLYAKAGFAVTNVYHNYNKELATTLG